MTQRTSFYITRFLHALELTSNTGIHGHQKTTLDLAARYFDTKAGEATTVEPRKIME